MGILVMVVWQSYKMDRRRLKGYQALGAIEK